MNLSDRIDACDRETNEVLNLYERSDLWRAIMKVIETSPIGKCPLIDLTHELYYLSDRGAFYLNEVYAYPPNAGKESKNTVRFVFDIYVFGLDYGSNPHIKNYMIDAPAALLNEFNQEQFDNWINDMNSKSYSIALSRAENELMKILENFPELKAKII